MFKRFFNSLAFAALIVPGMLIATATIVVIVSKQEFAKHGQMITYRGQEWPVLVYGDRQTVRLRLNDSFPPFSGTIFKKDGELWVDAQGVIGLRPPAVVHYKRKATPAEQKVWEDFFDVWI